jgi:hypothetical protein
MKKLLTLTLITSLLLLSLFVISCPTQFSDILKEILIGIVSAVFLLLLIEIRNCLEDKKKYGYLKGEYKRMKIFNSNLEAKSDTKYEEISYEGVDSLIKFEYHRNRQYKFEAQHKEGRIKAVIYIDQMNLSEGNGVYQYSKKLEGYPLPDMGYFKLIVDTLDSKRLYIYSKNLFPS